MLLDQFGIGSEDVDLRFVRIANISREQNRGGADNVRNPVHEQSTCARLGNCQRLSFLREQFDQQFFERFVTRSEN